MQRKAEQKKVSACCPHSGISDTLKDIPAEDAGACRRILQNARKCAQKKVACGVLKGGRETRYP